MKYLRTVLPFFILVLFDSSPAYSAEFQPIQQAGYTYSEKSDGALSVVGPQGEKNISDIFNGGSNSDFTYLRSFNKVPAVYYNPVSTRLRKELFYTLKQKNNITVVDCVYAHIQAEDDGRMTDKAVCNLDLELTPDFNEIFTKYDTLWRYQNPPSGEYPKTLSIEDGGIGGMKIVRSYEVDAQGMFFTPPETVISAGGKKFSFGDDSVFIVYDVADMKNPILLRVSKKGADYEDAFINYDAVSLKALLGK